MGGEGTGEDIQGRWRRGRGPPEVFHVKNTKKTANPNEHLRAENHSTQNAIIRCPKQAYE